MRFREGDYIKTHEELVFDVKGLMHPPTRVIAFIRYFPDETGDRKKDGRLYSKVYSLSKRYALLRERFPRYLVHDHVFDENLCEVPTSEVKRHYKPVEKLEQMRSSTSIDKLENLALQCAEQLKNAANIPWKAIGISGSLMVGLHTESSDMDPVVYGSDNCEKVYSTLKDMLKNEDSSFEAYTREDLKRLFDFRSKDTRTSFEDFVRTEARKVLQGKFMGRDYFIRCVKDWNEVEGTYGDVHYENMGYARIKATIADVSEAIFTPCTYKIKNVRVIEGPKPEPIEEIASFRGRFCEQASEDEVIVAQGKIELVKNHRRNIEYFRLLFGNQPSDFMILEQPSRT
jgi:predicted nucleotidyltransferase